MRIRDRRIRSLERHLVGVPHGTVLVVGLTDATAHRSRLTRIGFGGELSDGDSVLPAAVGPVSRFNAHGKGLVHKDRPKETHYRQIEWSWTEWRGRYGRAEQSRIVDVPYQRYPRTFVAPPSVEFTAVARPGGMAVVAPPVSYEPVNHALLLHVVNLFLELFGECDILDRRHAPLRRTPVRRLNWTVLPPGEMPWPRLRRHLEPLLREAGSRTRPVLEHRLQFVERHRPEFAAVGRGGFHGYVVFAFPAQQVYVVESARYGNATFVFRQDWERLSQMTKAEVIAGDLHADRIVHTSGWESRLTRWLPRPDRKPGPSRRSA